MTTSISIHNKQETKRNSSFELVRIIAMFVIVFAHFFVRSNAINVCDGLNYYLGCFVEGFSKISVNLFVMIGAWFLVEKEFNISRIFKIYLQMYFCMLLTLICLMFFGVTISLKIFIQFILPYTAVASSFVCSYINMLLISPLLNIIINQSQNILRKIITVLFIVFPFYMSIRANVHGEWFSNTVWFCYIYLFIGYFKKYIYNNLKINKYVVFGGAFFLYISVFVFRFLCDTNHWYNLSSFIRYQKGSAYSIYCFIIALGIFYFFTKINLKYNKIINLFGASAFTVYLVSDAPIVRHIVWSKLFYSDLWLNSKYFILYSILTIIMTYCACTIIEIMRKNTVEKLYINSKLYFKIVDFFNNLILDSKLAIKRSIKD